MAREPRLNDRLKIGLERAHLKNAQRIVAHSARMRDELILHYGIEPAKIVLLYPPVDGAQFSPVDPLARDALRHALGLPDDRAVFLLASTGHQRKGLDLLVDFFARTELPATLVVAGRAMPGSARNVRHLGYRSDLENVYRAVDFTVMASRYEPFGLVGVESVLCGTPVVLAQDIGCAEVIREPARIGFDRDSPNGLRDAIEHAVGRWRLGNHRAFEPHAALGYDPSVAAHVDALLALAGALVPPPSAR
jgi:glycosyltransferase involved in cell wall biosynthesis